MSPFLGGAKLLRMTWLSDFTNRIIGNTPARYQRQRPNCRRLLLERLEDRTLLDITPIISGNTVDFICNAAESVYLSSDMGILQYAQDGSAYSAVSGFDLTTADRTINSSNLIIVAGNLYTGGEDLTVHSDTGIEVESNVVISTRDISNLFSGNHLTDPSTANSGALTFEVKNSDPFDPIPFAINTAPHITLNTDSKLLAQAINQATSYTPGDVSLAATNTNLSLDLLVYKDIGVVVRDAAITVTGANIQGDTVDIEATGGDIALADQLNQVMNDNAATWLNGLIQNVTGYVTQYTTLPVSFMYKKGTAEVTVGAGSSISASGNVTVSAAASADATGQALYYMSTRVGGSFGFNWAETSATALIDQNALITSLGSVTVTSHAKNTINGAARVTQNIGGAASQNPSTNTSNIEVSGAVGVSDLTSHVTVAQNASIVASRGVTIDAEGEYSNKLSVQTASYYSGQVGMTFFLGYTESDVKAEVDGNITVNAAGATAASATFNPYTDIDFATSTIRLGSTSGLTTGDVLRYSSGIGAPIPGLADDTNYYVIVLDGQHVKLAATPEDAKNGNAITFGVFPTFTSGSITLPITSIDDSDISSDNPGGESVQYQFDTGLTTGSVVTYHAVAGERIGGLVDGAAYTVVAGVDPDNPYAFQLKDSSNHTVNFDLNPQMMIGGTAFDFDLNPDDGTLTFPAFTDPADLANGTALTYRASLGQVVEGLTDGQTYYAITNPYAPGVVWLAQTPINAALAYQEGQNSYFEAYHYFYDPAYNAWLAEHPGDTNGADSAGKAAVQAVMDNTLNAEADWFSGGATSASERPYLLTAAGIPLAIAKIDAASGTIIFSAPLTGIVANGDPLTYTAATGSYIDGLTDGTTYTAVFDPSNPTVLRLTKDGNPVSLNNKPALLRTDGSALDFSVNSDGQIVLANPPDDLATGEKLTYRQSLITVNADESDGTGGVYTGLKDGHDYYVILTATPGVINLARSLADAQAENAISGIAFTGIDDSAPIVIDVTIGDPLMSGTAHALETAPAGIIIKANLKAKDSGNTSTLLGRKPKVSDLLTKGELLPAFRGILGNYKDLQPNGRNSAEDAIKNNLPKDANGNPVTTGPNWNFAGSFGVQYIRNDIYATVGGAAVLKSNQNITVTATATERAQLEAESTIVQPNEASGATSFVAAVGIGLYQNTVEATVADGATLDASQKLTVNAALTYPFVFPILSGEDAIKYFGSDPIGNFSKFISGKLGLDSLLFNSWVRSVASGKENNWAVGGAVAVLNYQNVARATIGDATINQDPLYVSASQAVDVEANTSMEFNRLGGVFDLNITPEAAADYKRKGNKLAFYNPFGTQNAVGGVGGTVMVVLADNTTEASIAAATIAAPNGLTVDANTDLLELDLAQSGARAQNFGFAGTVTTLDITNRTTAQVGPGATVAGSSLGIDATDSTILVNVAGSIEKGNHYGFGFTATVNNLSRDTEAILGAGSADTPAASNIALSGDVDIGATNTGAVVSASFAAAIESNDPGQAAAAPNVAADGAIAAANAAAALNPNPNMNGGAGGGVGNNAPGKYGVAVSGDAAVNNITKDIAYAIINDSRPTDPSAFNIVAADVSLTAHNTTSVGTFAGTVAAATIPNNTTNVAVVGSFTWNVIRGDTEAYVNNAVMDVDSLSLDTKRASTLVSITAGVAAATGTSGIGVAGSVSVSDVSHTVAAYLDNAKVTLAGDTTIKSIDDTLIITVGGGVGYGGKAGVGPAVAVNLITNTSKAYIDGSTLSITGGAVNVVASNESTGTDARIVALAGTGGISSDGTGVAAMVAVNIIANTTQAYISDSTIANTGTNNFLVHALDNSWIVAIGLAIGAGENVGIGVALGYNEFKTQRDSSDNSIPSVTAYVDGSGITTGGSLTVQAENTFIIGTATLSGAGSGGEHATFTLAGAASVNLIETTVDAHISNSPALTTDPRIAVGGPVTVAAKDESTIVSICGDVSISTTGRAFGASISYNLIANDITAYIDNSSITTDDKLSVTATSDPLLVAIAVSGEGGKNYAAGGAITVNRIINTTDAHISGKSEVEAAGPIVVSAGDSSAMYVVAIGIVVSTGSIGGGAGVSANSIGDIADSSKKNVIKAYVDDSAVHSTGDAVTVSAGFKDPSSLAPATIVIANGMGENQNQPLTILLPADMTTQIFNLSIGGTGAEVFAFGGSVSLNYSRNAVSAEITSGADVTAAKAVTIAAGDTVDLISISGAVAIVIHGSQAGREGAIGISVAVNDISNHNTAKIDASTAVAAEGVSVAADVSPSIVAITVGGAFAGTTVPRGIAIAGAGAGSGNTLDNTVIASISGGSHVSNTGGAYAVEVAASDTSTIQADGGGVTVGVTKRGTSVTFAAGAAINNITNHLTATIDASTVTSAGAIDVVAMSDETITAIAIGFAGAVTYGTGGGLDLTGAGSGAGNTMNNTVTASITASNESDPDDPHSVTSGGTGAITVQATDDSTIKAYTGAAAIAFVKPSENGPSSAIGVSVSVNDITNVVTAKIDDSRVAAGGAVSLIATSTAYIEAITVAGGVGVGSGVIVFAGAGAGSQNTVDNTTKAIISGGSNVTSGNGQAVRLTATDDSTINADGGGLALGFNGGKDGGVAGALGAAAAVNEVSNTTTASIDASTVTSDGAVNVVAQSTQAKIFTVTVGVQGTLAIGGEGNFAFAGSGSGSGNTITNTIEASIANDSTVTTANGGNALVKALDHSKITAGAGALGVSIAGGTVAAAALSVAASIVISNITNEVKAYIDNATVTAAGKVDVDAISTAEITAVAVGASASVAWSTDIYGNASAALAGAGAQATNTIRNTVQAYVQNGAHVSGTTITISATDTPTSADDTPPIEAIAVGGTVSVEVSMFGLTIGVGVALAKNDVSNTVKAGLGQPGTTADTATLTSSGATNILVTSTPKLTSTAVAASISASVSIGAALTGGGGNADNFTTSTVSAFVQNGATVAATGPVTISAHYTPTINATMGTVAISGSVVGASVGVSLSTNTIGDTVSAYVDSGTVGSTSGDIELTATSNLDLTALAFATSLSISIGVSGAGANAVATDNTQVKAYTAGAAHLTANAGAVDISADSTSTIDATAPGGTAAIVGVGAMLATADVKGLTSAAVGAGATVHADAVNVTSTSNNKPTVLVAVAAIGAIEGQGTNGEAKISRVTEAYIGQASTTGSTTLVTANNPVTISATSTNTAKSTAGGGDVSTIGVQALLLSSTINGATNAYIGGDTTITASGVVVYAGTTSNANSKVILAGLSVLAGGNGTRPIATENHAVNAYIDTGANLTATGVVTLAAESSRMATAEATSGSGALGVDVDVLVASATISGTTQAYVSQGAYVSATGLNILATATSRNASATSFLVDVSIVAAGDGANTASTVKGTVAAFVGAAAGASATSTTMLDIGGKLTVQAQTISDTSTAKATGGTGGGGVEVDALITSADISGNTQAYVSPQVTVNATQVSVSASASKRSASSDSEVTGISFIASGNGTNTTSTVGGTVEAFVGAQAGSTGSPTALNVSGNVSINAQSATSSVVTLSVGGGAILTGVGEAESTATVTETTRAYLASGTTVGSASSPATSLAVNANAVDYASNSATVGVGGAIGVRGTDTDTDITSTIQAYIGAGASVNAKNDVNVTATSTRAEAHATASSYGGGVIDVGCAEATATSTPTVTAYIAAGTTITAGGNVSIQAKALGQSDSGKTYDDQIQGVNTTLDQITFPEHGVQTGDLVTYLPPEGVTPIQTPSGDLGGTDPYGDLREYAVIVIDPNTLQLGNEFDAAAVDTGDPHSTGDGFSTATGVDPSRNLIRFASPHYFRTGDTVQYNSNSNPSIGLIQGTTYYVRVIDEVSIKLYATLAQAQANVKSFQPTAVVNSAFQFNDLSFQNDEAVSYFAPAPILFHSTDVNVTYDSSTDPPQLDPAPGANDIFVGQHDFQNGDIVVYESDGDPINGLTVGMSYAVIVRDAYTIQLAHLETPTQAIAIDATGASTSVAHLLVRNAIGGLEHGVTYYVVNALTDPDTLVQSFQLAATPGGTPITLDTTQVSGTHSIGRDGVALYGGSGTQSLRIDISEASATWPHGDELLGPGGVSLRIFNPPAGSGKSSSSASGGSGGGVEVSQPTATTTVTHNATAYLAGSVQAGGNISIVAQSIGNSSSTGNNAGGGIGFGGTAQANTNFTSNARAVIGTPSAGYDATGTQIIAGGAFSLSADTELTTNVTTTSNGGGLIAITSATGNAKGTINTSAIVGANALIEANTASLAATNTNIKPVVTTDSHSGGLGGSATANSNIDFTDTASTSIAGGITLLTGLKGVDVIAANSDFVPDAKTDASFIGIGPHNNNPHYGNHLHANINAGAGATVEAGVRTASDPNLVHVSGHDSLALFVDAGDSNVSHTSEDLTAVWNANVIVSGGAATELTVDPHGNIVRAINAVVDDNGTPKTSGHINSDTIVVNPIGAGGAEVLMAAKNSLTNSANPLFTFLQNASSVTIINQSSKELLIHEIDAVGAGSPKVTLETNSLNFNFDIAYATGPTLVDIENQAATLDGVPVGPSDIILSSYSGRPVSINNPVGHTIIKNERGDIVTDNSESIVRTNTLDIEASGNIGTANRINVELVRSQDSAGVVRETGLTTVAGAGDIYIDLTGRLRDDYPAPLTLYVDELSAGSNVDVTLQSSMSDPGPAFGGGGITVQVIPDDTEHPLSGPYINHFHPDAGSPPILDRGAFGDTSRATPIDSTYQFAERDSSNALTGNPGLIAGDNISVQYVAGANDGVSDIVGITQLLNTGYIDTTTNGDIDYTEFGGTIMRVGTIESTAGNVQLTNPDTPTDGQDLELLTGIDAAGDVLLQIGDNVTTNADSLLAAGNSITLTLDYLNMDPDIGSTVEIYGNISSPATSITGKADDDIIHLNNAHGINSGSETAKVAVDGGGGSNNLKVDDSGFTGTDSGQMTFNSVSGLGMGGSGIEYFRIQDLEVDLSQGGTTFFDVLSTNLGTPTLVRGGGGNDNISIGSSLAADNGDLNNIQDVLTLVGNGGSDQVEVDDHANSDGAPATSTNDPAYGYNYLLTPSSVSNLTPTVDSVPVRSFAGIIFNASSNAAENTVTFLRLDCTDRTNKITVQPSMLTTFFVDGNLPVPGECRIDGGDYLQLDTSSLINGTGYREIHITGLGEGYWNFIGPDGTVYAQEVQFESIERYNHVGAVAAGAGAGFSGLPYVTVFDSETSESRGQFLAYEAWYRGGVRVAAADVNCDGFPDIITAPGIGHLPIIHIYSGSPDENGDYKFDLVGSFNVFTPAMQCGINLAIGDINGKGGHEIVVAADAGYLPEVEVYQLRNDVSLTATLESTFLAYESAFRGGLSVAVGDLNNDGLGELVTACGAGGFPTVNVYSFNSASSDFSLVNTFNAFPTAFQRGMDVAVGDYNGDGIRDIIVGAGAGWTPTVSIYSGTNAFNSSSMELISSFLAYDSSYRGGVKVTARTIEGDAPDFPAQVAIFTGFGAGNPSRVVREFTYTGANSDPNVVSVYYADLYYLFGLNFGSGGAGSGVVVTGISSFTDEDGDIFTVQLRGPGTAQVFLDDVDGDGQGAIASMIVQGTDSRKSSLTVNVSRSSPGDRSVSIGSIQVYSDINRINARYSDIVGDGIMVNGHVRNVRIGDMIGGADFIAGGSPADRTRFTANIINAGAVIDVGSTLTSFRAQSVSKADITAPAIRTMRIRGDFAGTTVAVTDSFRSFSAETFTDSELSVGGDLTSFRADAVFNADIAAAAIRTMCVRGDFVGTTVTLADSLRRFSTETFTDSELSVGGDLTLFRADAVFDADIAAAAIRSMRVGGDVAGTTATATGSVNNFSAQSFTDSNLFAGFTPAGPLAGVFNSDQEIGKFKVTGETSAFARSTVSASRIGKVTLASLDPNNSGTPFGILADLAVTRVAVGGVTQPIPRDELADDFEIRL